MADPFGFETFDPFAESTAATTAALYGGGCGPDWPDPDWPIIFP